MGCRSAWLLITTTGMRRGELAGLRWVDVDLEAARLSIRRPRVVVANAPQTSEPRPLVAGVPWRLIR
jgi:integrase